MSFLLSIFVPNYQSYGPEYQPVEWFHSYDDGVHKWHSRAICGRYGYRDSWVIFLWLALLWGALLPAGAWCLSRRQELSGKYANWMRLCFLAFVPILGWVSFGLPLLLAISSAFFGFLSESWKERKARGVNHGLGFAFRQAWKITRQSMKDDLLLAYGPISMLPAHFMEGASTEEEQSDEKENVNGEAVESKDVDSPAMKDEEKQALQTKQFAGLARSETNGHPQIPLSPVSTTTKALIWPLALTLAHLSCTTFILSQRRVSIMANSIIDDILWHMSLTGIAISIQATLLLLTEIQTHKYQSLPQEDCPPTPKPGAVTPTKPKYSYILLFRLGSHPTAYHSLHSLSPWEIATAIIFFYNLAYPRNHDCRGEPQWHYNTVYPYLDPLVRHAHKATLIGVANAIWITFFGLIHFAIYLLHRAAASALPTTSPLTRSLEALNPRIERAASWLRETWERRISGRLTSLLDRAYFPLWILCVYGVFYAVVWYEVLRLNVREHPRPKDPPCVEVWRDPWERKLLRPIYWIVEGVWRERAKRFVVQDAMHKIDDGFMDMDVILDKAYQYAWSQERYH